MLLAGSAKVALAQIMGKETLVHILTEEKYLQYLRKISEEKRTVHNLLFDEPRISGQEHIMAQLCECYSSLYHLDKILQDAEESFNPETSEFHVIADDALKFVICLSAVDDFCE